MTPKKSGNQGGGRGRQSNIRGAQYQVGRKLLICLEGKINDPSLGKDVSPSFLLATTWSLLVSQTLVGFFELTWPPSRALRGEEKKVDSLPSL